MFLHCPPFHWNHSFPSGRKPAAHISEEFREIPGEGRGAAKTHIFYYYYFHLNVRVESCPFLAVLV